MSGKIKHSKFKNTAIIYDSLIKQLMQDTISENKSESLNIIKKYFNSNSILLKELKLYQGILEGNFKNDTQALYFIDKMIQSRKKLNEKQLLTEKYNLINEIKKYYNIDNFFKTNIREYKQYASIFNLFQFEENVFPSELNKCKITLCESIVKKEKNKDEIVISENISEFRNLDPEIKTLAYKLMVESFNNKYSNILKEQKELLRNFILNTNSVEFLKFFKEQAKSVKEKLDKMSINNSIHKIKLNEVSKLLCKYKDVKNINENDIYSLLRYYDLINELDKKRSK
jgi:hypothetical protein